MVIVDANVLLYAVNESAPQHRRTSAWIEEVLSGHESVDFAWAVLLAFIRIASLPVLFPTPLSTSEALDVVDDWLTAPPAVIVQPTTRHPAVLRGLLVDSGTGGNLVADAHLAALSVEHGARICTFDRDFSRFSGVRVFSPADAGDTR